MSEPSSSLININLTEPFTKFIESVRAGLGALYEPTGIRRRASAEADAARIAASAQNDVALIKTLGDAELQLLVMRADERRQYLELRRQRNIDSIVDKAIDQLPESVSPDPVDEDWMVQFLNHAQDIGNDEMQQLWAKLLAGEVAKPGTYSPRTLQVVKLLRPSDADLFQRFCGYLVDNLVHFFTLRTKEIMKKKSLPFTAFVHLETLGLLAMPPDSSITVDGNEPLTIRYSGRTHIIEAITEFALDAILLTDVGAELAPLCKTEPDEEYRVALVEDWRANAGVKVTVQ